MRLAVCLPQGMRRESNWRGRQGGFCPFRWTTQAWGSSGRADGRPREFGVPPHRPPPRCLDAVGFNWQCVLASRSNCATSGRQGPGQAPLPPDSPMVKLLGRGRGVGCAESIAHRTFHWAAAVDRGSLRLVLWGASLQIGQPLGSVAALRRPPRRCSAILDHAQQQWIARARFACEGAPRFTRQSPEAHGLGCRSRLDRRYHSDCPKSNCAVWVGNGDGGGAEKDAIIHPAGN